VTEQRYLLTVAHQAGRDDRIVKGKDGRRDYFTPDELEKAAFSFIPGGAQVGLFHIDGTVGRAEVVESYIYRGPDWEIAAVDGTTQIVKSGDWLVGMICDPIAWDLYKTGRVSGVSIQGRGKRRRSS
jgi:hypothetical protein